MWEFHRHSVCPKNEAVTQKQSKRSPDKGETRRWFRQADELENEERGTKARRVVEKKGSCKNLKGNSKCRFQVKDFLGVANLIGLQQWRVYCGQNLGQLCLACGMRMSNPDISFSSYKAFNIQTQGFPDTRFACAQRTHLTKNVRKMFGDPTDRRRGLSLPSFACVSC